MPFLIAAPVSLLHWTLWARQAWPAGKGRQRAREYFEVKLTKACPAEQCTQDIQLECAVAQAEAASTPAVLDMQSPAVWCVARGVSSLTGVTTPSQARGSKRVNVRECSVRIAELRQPFESLPNARVGKSQSSLLLRQGSHIGHRTPARE